MLSNTLTNGETTATSKSILRRAQINTSLYEKENDPQASNTKAINNVK